MKRIFILIVMALLFSGNIYAENINSTRVNEALKDSLDRYGRWKRIIFDDGTIVSGASGASKVDIMNGTATNLTLLGTTNMQGNSITYSGDWTATSNGTHTVKASTGNNIVLEVTGGGNINFKGFGAGTAGFDAAGNVTTSSDIRKKNIQREFTVGLKEIVQIKPIIYKWKEETGLEAQHEYAGFSAQDVLTYIPEAVGIDKEGYYTLSDRAIIAALCNAINELNFKVEQLEAQSK